MTYIRMSSAIEYDPKSLMIRENGAERPAGLAALCYAFRDEVLQELGQKAVTVAAPADDQTGANPAAQSPLDGKPLGGGELSASGAPKIMLSASPVPNQYGYTGPAALNPYFTTPSNPQTEGFVQGFNNWFDNTQVVDSTTGLPNATVSKMYCSTEEGAEEALRLVKTYDPGATISTSTFGASGGPYRADKPTYEVQLSNGTRMNAGGVLWTYYSGGTGVTAYSDQSLFNSVQWGLRHPPANTAA